MKPGIDKHELQHLLKELQRELSRVEGESQETARALRTLREEVEQAVRELSEAEAAGSRFDHVPLGARLQEAVTRFETTHPRLTGVINNILNVLAGSGV